MLQANSVTQGAVATVSPSCPGSIRITTRFRRVRTARQGTPPTVRGAGPPVWPAWSVYWDFHFSSKVLLSKAMTVPWRAPTSRMSLSPRMKGEVGKP